MDTDLNQRLRERMRALLEEMDLVSEPLSSSLTR
jgi:hypothetical protein